MIYPHTIEDMSAAGLDDDFLEKILEIVHLQQIVRREGGWDALGDWKDILSGYQKKFNSKHLLKIDT